MSRNGSPSDGRILSLLFAFTVLFILVFGFGVFVGKRLGQQELRITKRFDKAAPAPSTPPLGESSEPGGGEVTATSEPEMREQSMEKPSSTPSPAPHEMSGADTGTDVVKVAPPEKTSTPKQSALDKRIAEITEQIRREKEAAESKQKQTAEIKTLPPVDPNGLYTVQIGSFQDQKQANSLAGSLRAKGYPVFVKSMTAPDNNKWYRVRVGTFSDIEKAKSYGEVLKRLEPSVKLVFITVNN